MLNELYSCGLKQWGLAVSLWRATYSFSNAWVVWNFSWDSFGHKLICMLPNPSTENFIWWQMMAIWGSVSLVLWQFHLYCLHLCTYFRKFLIVLYFHITTQMSLSFSCLSQYSFLILLFHPSICLTIPFQHNYLFYFHFSLPQSTIFNQTSVVLWISTWLSLT